jgi:hypothetical protein
LLATVLGLTGCPKPASLPAAGAPSDRSDSLVTPDAGEELPSADALLFASYDAMGGLEALRRHENRTTTGRLSIPAQGLTVSLVIRQQTPDRMETVSEVPGMGTTRQGTDGSVVWSLDSVSGPRLLEGAEANGVLRRAQCDWAEDLDRWFPERETVSSEEFHGEPSWKVRFVDSDGAAEFHWFSKETGLALGQQATVVSDMGTLTVRSTFSDFEEVEGVLMPMRLTQKMGPLELVTEIDGIDVNQADFVDITVPDELAVPQ